MVYTIFWVTNAKEQSIYGIKPSIGKGSSKGVIIKCPLNFVESHFLKFIISNSKAREKKSRYNRVVHYGVV